MPRLSPNTNSCACYYGTAGIDPITGNCICTTTVVNANPPPMPTVPPIAGFQWTWNATLKRWMQTRKPVIHADATPTLSGAHSAVKDFVKQKPLIALGIAGVAYYYLFAKK